MRTSRRPGRKTVFELLAQQLETDLPSFQGRRLPPIKELCHKYGVSNKTMLKAAAILRDKGLLWYGEGSKMLIVGRMHSAEIESGSAASVVCQYIEKKIQQGAFKTGQRLPKMDQFVSECKVSRDKAREALVKLEKKGLVHSVARKWYAGLPRPQTENSMRIIGESSPRNPTIILITANYDQYLIYSHYFTYRPLFQTLQAELNDFGIEMTVAMQQQGANSIVFPAGSREIAALIRKLGNGYMGCFIAGRTEEFPELDEMKDWLRKFGKPVGIFDEYVGDEQGIPSRLGRECFRAYTSYGKATRMAADILHAAGHRSIAFLTNTKFETYSWLPMRRAVVHDQARLYNDGTAITDIAMSEPSALPPKNDEWFWKYTNQFMMERIENLRKSSGGPPMLTLDEREAIKRLLVADQPEIETVVSRRRHTAVIVACDEFAADFVVWMKYTGRQIPRDMSIISLDNHPVFAPHKFSSLDFGRADLGYLIAHRFIGDIPVQKDANGNITTEPRLFDRRSIIAPAKQRRG
jgi:DNA-binding LacI/PurR family transcriptional regulator/DNA-binding transcriptional regulator YhcF (GntR family)